MSYNISNITVKRNTLKMKAYDIVNFADNREADLPECNMFSLETTDFVDEARVAMSDGTPSELIDIQVEWYGEFSGNSAQVLLKEILPLTTGDFEGMVVWEGGDKLVVLTVTDGKVSQKDWTEL